MQAPRFRYSKANRSHSDGPRPPRSSVPICLYCKRKGQIIAECWELEKKKRVNPVLMVCAKSQNPSPAVGEEEKNPFISGAMYQSVRVVMLCLFRS